MPLNTQNTEELKKFEKMAHSWWQPNGAFKPLHRLNPLRLNFIITEWQKYNSGKTSFRQPFQALKILDIGCGGGLMSFACHDLGAEVLGIDAEATTIKIANWQKQQRQIDKGLEFINTSPEQLALEKKFQHHFDLVLALEIIEHVEQKSELVKLAANFVKPNGMVVFSTINRNLKAWLFAIIGAEYLLQLLPKGTHNYHQLVKPEELLNFLRAANLNPITMTGVGYNPLTENFFLTNNFSVNYMLISCA